MVTAAQVDSASRAMSAAALVVSIVAAAAALRSARHTGRAVHLERERRDEEKERQQRAEMTGRFETIKRPEPRSGMGDHYLVLENRGRASARDVTITLSRTDRTVVEGQLLILEPDELPIPVVDPGGSYRIMGDLRYERPPAVPPPHRVDRRRRAA